MYKQAEAARSQADAKYRALFETMAQGVIYQNDAGEIISANPAAERILGLSLAQMQGRTFSDSRWRAIREDGSDFPGEAHASMVALATGQEVENVVMGAFNPMEGEYRWINVHARPQFREGEKTPYQVYITFEDITERKQVEDALRESKERLSLALEGAELGLWDWNVRTGEMTYNQRWAEMLGYTLDEIKPHVRFWTKIAHPDDIPHALKVLKDHLKGKTPFYKSEHRLKTKSGEWKWVLCRAKVMKRDENGNPLRVSGIQLDITERKIYETKLHYQANYDALTKLPNRTLLQDRLRHALAHAKRHTCRMAVLFLDLDRFKVINDSLGHGVGDALLQAVAQRLAACVRKEDTVARQGGDEFVIVLEDVADEEAPGRVARKILAAVERPLAVDSQTLFVNCSIGISLFPRDGQTPETLIRNADAALHRAKERGRNAFQFYTPEMNARLIERLSLENSLRQALSRNELELYYQPKADLTSDRIFGVEALLRWRHPQWGLISPAKFIPLAEETGLIIPMGEWVLQTACAQAKAWQSGGMPDVSISVNLSTRQFIQPYLIDRLIDILQETGLPASHLELEITESLLMQNVGEAIAILRALKDRGMSLAIDDFGTGYSSLNYLKRFPIDRLKIDQSFVLDITIDPDDAAITQAIIALAHSLHLQVIAEGVETEAQRDFLESKGCDEIQGYYLSRPLPAEEIALLLRDPVAQPIRRT